MGIEYIPFGAGGAASQARNPIHSYVDLAMPLGGLTITNSNGANAISAYTALSSPANALYGILLTIQNASANTSHCQVYLRVNGVVVITGIYFKLNTSDSTQVLIPIKIPAGATVELAIRTNANGHARLFAVEGVEANAIDAPGYSLVKNLTPDTAGTLAGTVNVPGTDTWIVSADVDDDYSAFMTTISDSGTAPTTGQMNTIAYGLGTPGSNALNNPGTTGAVAGTPGTLPNNWAYGVNVTGLTSTVVGTGTENGVAYMDLRVFGTPGSSGAVSVYFDTPTGIAATSGQPWSASVNARVAAGSLANITNTILAIDENTSGAAYVTGGSAPISLTSTLTAFAYSRTLNGGGTVAAIRPFIRFSVTAGQAIDVTLRIGLPGLAQVTAPSSAFWRFQQRFSTAQPYIVHALSPVVRMALPKRSIIFSKVTCPVADSVSSRPGIIGFKS